MKRNKQIIKAMLFKVTTFLKKNYIALCNFTFFLLSVFVVLNFKYGTKLQWIAILLFGYILISFLKYYLKSYFEKDEFDDFPVLKERLTKKTKGTVYLKTEDLQKATLFLSNVEDYLQNRGML